MFSILEENAFIIFVFISQNFVFPNLWTGISRDVHKTSSHKIEKFQKRLETETFKTENTSVACRPNTVNNLNGLINILDVLYDWLMRLQTADVCQRL